jgi:hypothetical protein
MVVSATEDDLTEAVATAMKLPAPKPPEPATPGATEPAPAQPAAPAAEEPKK